jgi:thiol-disulfide isomerase/thioredoxin
MKRILSFLFVVAFCLQVSADEKYPRKIVMEEGTGTWCGWCVRGIETIKLMSEKYPDNFIGIALHNGDEMDNIENYKPVLNHLEFFPGCLINRRSTQTEEVDFFLQEEIVLALKDDAIAKIEATASFTDDTQKLVLVKTKTTFGFDKSSANYKIAYVVMEDNVGPYVQGNYYSGLDLKSSDYMYEWTTKERSLSITFNDVARGIYPSADGESGSVPSTVETGVAYEYEYTVNLPSTVSDPKNISIVTLLLDDDSGEILNADKVSMAESTTGIQTLKRSSAEEGKWYNLNGQRVKNPTKGIYIKDGKKILVK